MVREGVAIGTTNVNRFEPGPFPDRQIELLKTFADQAVIAIENVRLFKELQENNRALTEAHARLTEAFEQQGATSGVLRVVSTPQTSVRALSRSSGRTSRPTRWGPEPSRIPDSLRPTGGRAFSSKIDILPYRW